MQGMQCEERGHEGGAPGGAGHAPQQAEEHVGVGEVKQNAREVVAGGIRAIKLAIQHVGQPGERVPIARIAGRKRPKNICAGQPGMDLNVVGDVFGVIIIVELEAEHGPIKGQRDEGQKQADIRITAETGGFNGRLGDDRHLHVEKSNRARSDHDWREDKRHNETQFRAILFANFLTGRIFAKKPR